MVDGEKTGPTPSVRNDLLTALLANNKAIADLIAKLTPVIDKLPDVRNAIAATTGPQRSSTGSAPASATGNPEAAAADPSKEKPDLAKARADAGEKIKGILESIADFLLKEALPLGVEEKKQESALRLKGASEAQVKAASDAAFHSNVVGVTPTEILEVVNELVTESISIERASQLAPEIVKLNIVHEYLTHSKATGMAEATRHVLDAMSWLKDPNTGKTTAESERQGVDMLTRVEQSTHVDPKQLAAFFNVAGDSFKNMNEEGFIHVAEMIEKVGDGSKAAASLLGLDSEITSGKMPTAQAKEWEKFGLAKPEGKTESGADTQFAVGAIVGLEHWKEDPVGAIVEGMVKRGLDRSMTPAQLTDARSLLSDQPAIQKVIAAFAEKPDELKENAEQITKGKVLGYDELVKSDPGLALRALTAELETLKLTIGEALVPVILPALHTLNEVLKSLAAMAHDNKDGGLMRFAVGLALLSGVALKVVGDILSAVTTLTVLYAGLRVFRLGKVAQVGATTALAIAETEEARRAALFANGDAALFGTKPGKGVPPPSGRGLSFGAGLAGLQMAFEVPDVQQHFEGQDKLTADAVAAGIGVPDEGYVRNKILDEAKKRFGTDSAGFDQWKVALEAKAAHVGAVNLGMGGLDEDARGIDVFTGLFSPGGLLGRGLTPDEQRAKGAEHDRILASLPGFLPPVVAPAAIQSTTPALSLSPMIPPAAPVLPAAIVQPVPSVPPAATILPTPIVQPAPSISTAASILPTPIMQPVPSVPPVPTILGNPTPSKQSAASGAEQQGLLSSLVARWTQLAQVNVQVQPGKAVVELDGRTIATAVMDYIARQTGGPNSGPIDANMAYAYPPTGAQAGLFG